MGFTGGKRRRRRKKKKKKNNNKPVATEVEPPAPQAPAVEIEYVAGDIGVDASDPQWAAFADVIKQFAPTKDLVVDEGKGEDAPKEENTTTALDDSDSDSSSSSSSEDEGPSKKKQRKLNRLSVAELKQLVPRPDVVEVHDVTANDPRFLVHLKSYRNTVPVPIHWKQKRRYLQNKRGIEKVPYQLPDYIEATGISKIRSAVQEQEDDMSLKQKQRARLQPKMGKLDIDYQVLHDAFFRYQTKPEMTIHGDMYHEGKENMVNLKEKRPGILSDELVQCLGIPEGAPPPWLINMQRYGPPPSYPNLKIPGLNAPIPSGRHWVTLSLVCLALTALVPGASFGYHPGGWGKPPVDEAGRPLYGDVFGLSAPQLPAEASMPIGIVTLANEPTALTL